MNSVEKIKDLLKEVSVPLEGYNFYEEDKILWGKDAKGNVTFAFKTQNDKVIPLSQNTRHLKLSINNQYMVTTQNGSGIDKLSAITLISEEPSHIELFIKLALAFCNELDETKLIEFFIGLKELFSNPTKHSRTELQGIYGELFVMLYINEHYGVDISKHYQSEQKRKFDFSISEKKKIEVKTTQKPQRIHHFLQQQLDTERYDIKVGSIMLQKDDKGTSLHELIQLCETAFYHNFNLMMQLEKLAKRATQEDLDSMRFNWDYSLSNMKMFDAINVPRLKEKNDEGIFNVEYDCDLSNVEGISENELLNWMKG